MDEGAGAFSTEGLGETYVHPLGLLVLLVCGITFVLAPRRWAIVPFLGLICFISARQALALGGLNLFFPRVMILVFWPLRLLIHQDGQRFRINRLDWLIIAYGVAYFVAGALNTGLSPSEMKTRAGYGVQFVGTYFVCRTLIQSVEDFRFTIRALAVIALAQVPFFLIEFTTARNLFAVFGGLPEITLQREGRLRCQGPFAHPIIAGTFWATMLPLVMCGYLDRWPSRWVYAAGAGAIMLIVFLTASSTPLLGVLIALCGWGLYRWRRYSGAAFVLFGVMLVVMHLVMKAPVWHLIARINVTSGNSGYHRFLLVDGFINHASEWFWLGSLEGTAHWGHFTFDTANQFVSAGISGGIGQLTLFVAIIVVSLLLCARICGRLPMAGWAVAVSVFVVTCCFLGISVWGQMHLAFCLPIAMVGGLYQTVSVAVVVPRANRLSSVQR